MLHHFLVFFVLFLTSDVFDLRESSWYHWSKQLWHNRNKMIGNIWTLHKDYELQHYFCPFIRIQVSYERSERLLSQTAEMIRDDRVMLLEKTVVLAMRDYTKKKFVYHWIEVIIKTLLNSKAKLFHRHKKVVAQKRICRGKALIQLLPVY